MKINFELSKKINELFRRKKRNFEEEIKTLTLEETIKFITKNNIRFSLYVTEGLTIVNNIYYENDEIKTTCIINIEGKTTFEAIEKMIEYLLKNNLLGIKK